MNQPNADFDESLPGTWLPAFAAAVAQIGSVLATSFSSASGWWDWAVDLELPALPDTTIYAGVKAGEDEDGYIMVRGRLTSLHRGSGAHRELARFVAQLAPGASPGYAAVTAMTVEILAALSALTNQGAS